MTHLHAKWTSIGMAAITVVMMAGCGSPNATGTNSANNGTNNAATNNAAGGNGTGSSGGLTINETGSSLLYPLFNGQWIAAYKKVDSKVTITAASTGSGAGISQAVAGTVQIGASDAYMATAQMNQNKGIINIPLAISAQQIMYNLPGLSKSQHVKLSGPVIAKIYQGKIQYWDDSAITSLNPGVKLPHQAIIPVHRSDGSGDTFLFTQYLDDTSPSWSTVGYGTSVSWPSVPGGVSADGNSGVVQEMASNPYSIGYVGISWLDNATKQGLGYAALQNKAGKFVLPTPANIQAAALAMTSKVPSDERVSLINGPGASSYPIINFEYAIINTNQPANMAKALTTFLMWAISPSGGNSPKYLNPVHFLPLPTKIMPLSSEQIVKIGKPGA